jgi:molybdenum cofactor cytidylyltransferase
VSAYEPIIAILLAAGAGTRFGGGKLLHPLPDGVAIAAHAVRNLREAGLEVVAVVRPGDFPLADMLEQEGCHVTRCPDAAKGMGHSLAHGVASAREASGWIVALADMPRVKPQTLKRLIDAISSGAPIAAPVYQGARGHPVAFSAALAGELIALSGDTGARAVLERHRDDLVLVEVDDPGVVVDIDAKADLSRLG